MMKINCLIISIFILYSCTTEPDLDIPMPSPKICMAGFVSTDSIMVYLYKNEYILADYNIDNLEDITIYHPSIIKIYENGFFFSNLTLFQGTYISYYTTDKKPSAGNEYSIEVSVNGYPDIFSKTIIPQKVPILSVDTFNYLIEGYPYTMCTINFKDTESIDNYYYFEVLGRSKGTLYYGTIEILSEDPIIEEKIEFGGNQLLFSDKNIQGKKYGLKVSISTYRFLWSDLNFVLYSVSKDFYLHFKSYVHYDKAKQDEFSEPVLIYSNIQNGIGIFAGYSTSVDSIMGSKNTE